MKIIIHQYHIGCFLSHNNKDNNNNIYHSYLAKSIDYLDKSIRHAIIGGSTIDSPAGIIPAKNRTYVRLALVEAIYYSVLPLSSEHINFYFTDIGTT